MHIAVHWQDADSTSEKAFRVHYPEKPKKPEKPEIDESTDKPKEESIVMHCAGHVVRSHMKALDAFQTMKKFTPVFCTQHQKDFPDIAEVRCHCHKRHSPQCGCFTPKFLVQARKNFNCCLKQAGKSAASFALRMQTLGKYHARDIHQWESGKPYKVCTCGKCKDKSHVKVNCAKPWQVNVVFTQIASALVVNVVRMRLNVMGSLTTANIPSLIHSML